jgi:hypothetical protein
VMRHDNVTWESDRASFPPPAAASKADVGVAA